MTRSSARASASGGRVGRGSWPGAAASSKALQRRQPAVSWRRARSVETRASLMPAYAGTDRHSPSACSRRRTTARVGRCRGPAAGGRRTRRRRRSRGRVGSRARSSRRLGPEGATEPGHDGVTTAASRETAFVTPDEVQEQLRVDGLAATEHQDGEEISGTLAARRQVVAVAEHLKRAENAVLHVVIDPRRTPPPGADHGQGADTGRSKLVAVLGRGRAPSRRSARTTRVVLGVDDAGNVGDAGAARRRSRRT